MEKKEFLVRLDAAASEVSLLLAGQETESCSARGLLLAALQSARNSSIVGGATPQEAETHPVILAVMGLYCVSLYPSSYLERFAAAEYREDAWEAYREESARAAA